jgi:hypothetical protein
MKCTKCSQEKDSDSFVEKSKTLKNCRDCRDKAKLWRAKNKERISDYNKLKTIEKRNKKATIKVLYGKPLNLEDIPLNWTKFKSQRGAANKLNLQPSNINKVLKKHIEQTGNYIFKLVDETNEIQEVKSWDEIKKEKEYEDLIKGKPSQHRIPHETIDSVIGKKCCRCKLWKPLTDYNELKSHWDKLRNDCKTCLTVYRKENRRKIQDNMNKYEKKRKLTDPEFKLVKTLRSRLGSALKAKRACKNNNTMELTGCDIKFLKGYIAAKFTDGMTWENHGEWHIDHIKPCCSFNLLDGEEQKKCFHYTNLQPLWAIDNLSKGGKI